MSDPENPSYDEDLLARINEKLNAFIVNEISDDQGMREQLMEAQTES